MVVLIIMFAVVFSIMLYSAKINIAFLDLNIYIYILTALIKSLINHFLQLKIQ